MNIAEKTLLLKADIDGVYDKGKEDSLKEFWGKLLNYGKQKSYYCGFRGYAWTNDTFQPMYDIYASNSTSMFAEAYLLTDLSACLDKHKVKIIFSNASTNHFYCFDNSYLEKIPYLTMPTSSRAYGWFRNCKKLVEVEGLYCNENNEYTDTFLNCEKLTRIIFDGVIANNINISYSPLDSESIVSLIEHLKPYPEDAGSPKHTVTLKESAFEALEDEEGTWGKAINALGWNLTLIS